MPILGVFISHISEEHELAELFKKRLTEDFLGMVNVFVSSDVTSMSVGANWAASIQHALSHAGIFLVVCSRTSIRRPWINLEVGAAWMKQTPIVPVCHTGLRPTELPMPLSGLLAVEAHDVNGLERLYSRIAEILQCKPPKVDFQELARQVRQLEAVFETIAVTPLEPRPTEGLDTAYSRVAQAINDAPLGWTLSFIGEDQSDKLAVLTEDLRREFSETGDGKQFASGFSYWGIGPTLAWERACNDPLYRVMKRSIDSFPERWNHVRPYLTAPYHYVSLGVGTGTKDRRILWDLTRSNRGLYYFPVDMSPEMLRVGTREYLASKDIQRCRLLPIQIDFSIDTNVAVLHRMLGQIIGDEPILFSLLGNTLANFEADTEVLRILRALMRQQDRFLLEVATTVSLDGAAVRAAEDEYAGSEAFKKFVTSALLQYTDLPVGIDAVDFHSLREGDKAILINVVYQNVVNRVLPVKLPGNSIIEFAANDTIRLYISRKYTSQGITSSIAEAGFSPLARHSAAQLRGFGLDLILLAQDLSFIPHLT